MESLSQLRSAFVDSLTGLNNELKVNSLSVGTIRLILEKLTQIIEEHDDRMINAIPEMRRAVEAMVKSNPKGIPAGTNVKSRPVSAGTNVKSKTIKS
jgi:hypothetical protein